MKENLIKGNPIEEGFNLFFNNVRTFVTPYIAPTAAFYLGGLTIFVSGMILVGTAIGGGIRTGFILALGIFLLGLIINLMSLVRYLTLKLRTATIVKSMFDGSYSLFEDTENKIRIQDFKYVAIYIIAILLLIILAIPFILAFTLKHDTGTHIIGQMLYIFTSSILFSFFLFVTQVFAFEKKLSIIHCIQRSFELTLKHFLTVATLSVLFFSPLLFLPAFSEIPELGPTLILILNIIWFIFIIPISEVIMTTYYLYINQK